MNKNVKYFCFPITEKTVGSVFTCNVTHCINNKNNNNTGKNHEYYMVKFLGRTKAENVEIFVKNKIRRKCVTKIKNKEKRNSERRPS